MTFKDLQKDVDDWISQFEEGYWPPETQVVCLTEEVGELAREINHRFGPKQRKPTEDDGNLAREMADIVVILCCIANSQGINLDDAWNETIEKFKVRDKDRFKRKEQ